MIVHSLPHSGHTGPREPPAAVAASGHVDSPSSMESVTQGRALSSGDKLLLSPWALRPPPERRSLPGSVLASRPGAEGPALAGHRGLSVPADRAAAPWKAEQSRARAMRPGGGGETCRLAESVFRVHVCRPCSGPLSESSGRRALRLDWRLETAGVSSAGGLLLKRCSLWRVATLVQTMLFPSRTKWPTIVSG